MFSMLLFFKPLKPSDYWKQSAFGSPGSKNGHFDAYKRIPCETQNNKSTATFVVWRCPFCKLRRDFGFFCSIKHLSEGGVNANHNQARSASFTRNNQTDNDCRQESLFPLCLDYLRIAKEIAMVSEIFVEGRNQTLLYSC